MKYSFYITYNSVTQQVHPLGVDKLKIVGEAEEGRIFMRRKLSGSLIFTSDDYAFFKAIDDDIDDRCAEISIVIKQSCDNGITYSDYWEGYFSTTDGKFDIDRCIFEVEPFVDDEYRCIYDGLKTETTFNAIQPATQTTGYIPSVTYEYFVCRDTIANCNASRPGPNASTTWLPFHTEIIDGATTTIYYREVAVTACQAGVEVEPSGAGWVEVISGGPSCGVEGLRKYVRQPIDVVTYNPNPDVSPGTCIDGVATTPPMAKMMAITKSSSRPTPAIVGPAQIINSQIASPTGCHNTFFYTIPNPEPGSAFAWSITGSAFIVSGAGTYQIELWSNAGGNFTIECIETSSCGVHSMSSLVVNSQTSPAGSYTHWEIPVTAVDSVCAWQDNLIIKVPKLNGDINALGGFLLTLTTNVTDGALSYSGVINGYYTWVLDASGVSDSVDDITFNISTLGITCDPNWSGSHIITKKGNHKTQDIQGSNSVCPSAVMTYYVQEKTGATYLWTISGGTINSGQGTGEIEVTWGSAGDGDGELTVKETLNCSCNWVQIADCGYSGEPPFYLCISTDDGESFGRNWLLQDAINFMKEVICPILGNVVSDFFQWNPAEDTRGYIDGINYVTSDTNKIKYITIAPAIDLVYFDEIIAGTKQPDLKEKLSWERIEKIMVEVFNCYWFIENGNIRIEHFSWFQIVVAYDLTIGNYLKYIKGKNIYSYDKLKVPKYERFKWAQSLGTDFTGAEISYSGLCVNPDPLTTAKERGEQTTTTDIIYLFSSDPEVNVDGIVLMVNNFDGGAYTLAEENGQITGISYVNAHLSWANLHYNYHRHNRSLLNGMMNLIPTVFLSAVRFKKQEGVRFPFCCIDEIVPESDLIKTLVGEGVVSKYELGLKDDIIIADLLHE